MRIGIQHGLNGILPYCAGMTIICRDDVLVLKNPGADASGSDWGAGGIMGVEGEGGCRGT